MWLNFHMYKFISSISPYPSYNPMKVPKVEELSLKKKKVTEDFGLLNDCFSMAVEHKDI